MNTFSRRPTAAQEAEALLSGIFLASASPAAQMPPSFYPSATPSTPQWDRTFVPMGTNSASPQAMWYNAPSSSSSDLTPRNGPVALREPYSPRVADSGLVFARQTEVGDMARGREAGIVAPVPRTIVDPSVVGMPSSYDMFPYIPRPPIPAFTTLFPSPPPMAPTLDGVRFCRPGLTNKDEWPLCRCEAPVLPKPLNSMPRSRAERHWKEVCPYNEARSWYPCRFCSLKGYPFERNRIRHEKQKHAAEYMELEEQLARQHGRR